MSEANLLFEVLKQCNPFHRFPFRSLNHMNTSLSSDEHSPDPPPTTSYRFTSEKGKTKTPFKNQSTKREKKQNKTICNSTSCSKQMRSKMAPRSTGLRFVGFGFVNSVLLLRVSELFLIFYIFLFEFSSINLALSNFSENVSVVCSPRKRRQLMKQQEQNDECFGEEKKKRKINASLGCKMQSRKK